MKRKHYIYFLLLSSFLSSCDYFQKERTLLHEVQPSKIDEIQKKYLEQQLLENPSDSKAVFKLARLEHEYGNHKKALQLTQKAIVLDEKYHPSFQLAATINYELGKFIEAENFALKAEENGAKSVELYELCIQIALELEKNDRVNHYIHLLDIFDHNHTKLDFFKAMNHLQGEDTLDAFVHFKRSLKQEEVPIESYEKLSLIYFHYDSINKAMDVVDTGLKQDPQNVALLLTKSLKKKTEGDIEKERKVLRQVLKIDPKNEQAVLRLSSLLIDHNEFGNCAKLIKDYLHNKGKKSVELLTRLANAQFALKEYHSALNNYENALRLDPNDAFLIKQKNRTIWRINRANNHHGNQNNTNLADQENKEEEKQENGFQND